MPVVLPVLAAPAVLVQAVIPVLPMPAAVLLLLMPAVLLVLRVLLLVLDAVCRSRRPARSVEAEPRRNHAGPPRRISRCTRATGTTSAHAAEQDPTAADAHDPAGIPPSPQNSYA
ncbi:MAG TPA: hypothetical protein VFG35_10955, partial [Actinoplanes sp.]|nr:hypothetical protein [Actinoplanes sp.]